jgi:site-specific recombinase XerD
MTPPTLVGPLLQFFFTDYLIAQRRASPQTIASYRDTFRLLLQFVDRETGVGPTALPVASLDAGIILRFLDSLEKNRGNSVVSRNLRLTAIRSFYRMVAFRDPASTGVATHVLAIPLKRADTKVRPYLTRDEMEAILASIDRTQWRGRRDYALLLTLYNTGARVSEIAALQRNHVSISSKSYVQLHGKGRKDRMVPLWPRTAKILKEWFRELQAQPTTVAFPSIRGEPLTRFAIHLLLRKVVERAHAACPSLKNKRISPHVLRHSTAMALLQSGVDIAVMALWLGHESIETTNQYLHANMAIKEKALATLQPVGKKFRRFKADDTLLDFLANL